MCVCVCTERVIFETLSERGRVEIRNTQPPHAPFRERTKRRGRNTSEPSKIGGTFSNFVEGLFMKRARIRNYVYIIYVYSERTNFVRKNKNCLPRVTFFFFFT